MRGLRIRDIFLVGGQALLELLGRHLPAFNGVD
jgi:hypothetical protein